MQGNLHREPKPALFLALHVRVVSTGHVFANGFGRNSPKKTRPSPWCPVGFPVKRRFRGWHS